MGTWYEILPPEQLWEHSVTASWKVSSVEINTTPHMLHEGLVHRLASPPWRIEWFARASFSMTFPNSSHARGFFPPQQLLLLQHFWLSCTSQLKYVHHQCTREWPPWQSSDDSFLQLPLWSTDLTMFHSNSKSMISLRTREKLFFQRLRLNSSFTKASSGCSQANVTPFWIHHPSRHTIRPNDCGHPTITLPLFLKNFPVEKVLENSCGDLLIYNNLFFLPLKGAKPKRLLRHWTPL